jgi:hypothetical protein
MQEGQRVSPAIHHSHTFTCFTTKQGYHKSRPALGEACRLEHRTHLAEDLPLRAARDPARAVGVDFMAPDVRGRVT